MKTLKYFSYVIMLLIISCSEDFLQLEPLSNPNVNSLYQTDEDFNQAVSGVYAAKNSYYNNFWQFSELRGDNADHPWTGYLSIKRMAEFNETPTEGILVNTWRSIYSGIFRANILLEKLDEADASLVPNLNRYRAETLFLRSLDYFNLVRVWGEVPLVLNTITAEESLTTAQAPVSEIYNSIITDLQLAEQNLPLSYSGNDIGRVTKGAAATILSKVYLTVGDFAAAESKLAEVMQMGYALLDDYNLVFDHFNEHHAEYIFDIEYQSEMSGQGSPFAYLFVPNLASLRQYYGLVGTGGETLSPTEDFFNLFEEIDMRKEISAVRGFSPDGDTIITTYLPYTQKYITPIISQDDSRVNWKVTRFADVVLMYAEALNENGKTSLALTELNKIRDRAGVSLYDELSQAETREAIAEERRRELGMEGHRWFDLLRYGNAFEVMTNKGYNLQPHQLLFPKPQQEIDVVNDPSVLSQNPGYE